MTFDKKKYDQEFIKNNYIEFRIKLNKNKDLEIINFLNSKQNKTSYLKSLIENDMKKEKGE